MTGIILGKFRYWYTHFGDIKFGYWNSIYLLEKNNSTCFAMLQEFYFNFGKKYNLHIFPAIKMVDVTARNLMLTVFIAHQPSWNHNTAQKMVFSINDFFSKCDQICSFLRIWSHLLKKYFMQNFIFCAV